jgi:hypothetical protein
MHEDREADEGHEGELGDPAMRKQPSAFMVFIVFMPFM